jgi:predicted GIY-YIG superfamily endonuclease
MAVLYRHIRLDKNEPFYIGIGKEYKRAYSKHQRNATWSGIAKRVDYQVEIMLEDLTWEEAQQKEREFIALYGRIDLKTGILANRTEGGEGALGRSKEANDRISKALKGRISPMKGRVVSEETKQKMRGAAITRGPRKWSQESREKMKQHMLAYHAKNRK